MRQDNERPESLWGLSGKPDSLSPGYRRHLFLLLGACFALRLALAWWLPSIHQPDEVYQVAEQAHRSVHGYGVITWEFQTASRAAFLPTLVKPIYQLAASAETRQLLVSGLFALLSLLPIWVAFHWTARLYGAGAGWLAGALAGTWFELLYFAPKPTADAVGGYLFVTALFLLRPAARRSALFAGGACLALALGVRLQILPAVGLVLLLAILVHRGRRLLPLAAGLAAGLTIVGIEEWLWWGAPFRGHWNYLRMEFVHGASQFFTREPITFYVKNAVLIYGGALPVIIALILAGARKAPVLLIALVALLVPFHFIGHKEYRFAVAAVPVMVVLLTLGIVDLLVRFAPSAAGRPAKWPLWMMIGWISAMAAMSLGDTYRPNWTKNRNAIFAFRDIAAQPDACGVALINIRWWHTPGYSGLGRQVPVYEIANEADAPRLQAAANYVLAGTKAPPPPAPYVPWREYTRPVQHLYKRPGGCAPDPARVIDKPPLIPGLTQ